ncbi:hypothetical protein B0H14DRAFT_2582882 [Mycena olivaceomarginata]|nr:hypothetical protein B0H14DRAFT_2582882 [Mycena olivaceomarginata]
MSNNDTAPLTATENAALRALLARADTTPRTAGNGNGGVTVQTDNTACEIDNFASPTFKSLPMWFPRVRSAVLDLIIEGKFEAEDLIKLSSHAHASKKKEFLVQVKIGCFNSRALARFRPYRTTRKPSDTRYSILIHNIHFQPEIILDLLLAQFAFS